MNHVSRTFGRRIVICQALAAFLVCQRSAVADEPGVSAPPVTNSARALGKPLARGAKAVSSKTSPRTTPPSTGQVGSFAPLPDDHALALTWNDPDFQRRLMGSYGFASDTEPRMQPEEQLSYREKVLPALTNSDPKKVISTLTGLIKPGASAVFDFTLGNVYFQNEDLTNAAKCFETALAKFPDYLRAQKNLAFVLVRDGRYDAAIKPLTRTIALGGGDGKVFGLLGFAYLNQGRYASAEAAYGQALIFEPENLDFRLGCVKCAVATANYDHALSLLEELLAQYPERDNLWTLQANIYIQKDQPGKAAISLEMLRRLGKATASNLYLLGDLYMSQEARELALTTYLEAITADHGQNTGKALRAGQILVSRGAWVESRKLFASIRAAGTTLSDPDELKLLRLESKVALSTGAGAEAILVLEKLIERNPLDGEALLMAGDFYAKNDQREKAEFRYDTASKLEGFQAEAWVKHAQLLVQTQKYARAVELLRKAQKVKPRENVQRYLDKVEQMGRTGHS
jgi:tetratricopeptide (TPR) repeat protein